MSEMPWFKERGLIANLQDYLDLPLSVLEDGRLLMEAEAQKRELDAKRNRPR